MAKQIRARSRGSRWTAETTTLVFLRYIAGAIHRVEPIAPEAFGALVGSGGLRLVEARPAGARSRGRSDERRDRRQPRAVIPVTGAARVVQCAANVALALGYDVDAALERHDA